MELKELRERFRSDRFAAAMGAEILEARPGYARCGLALGELHRNAAGGVMGGVTFTNCERLATVSLSSQIAYLSRPKGERLIAVANRVKEGRSTCYYTVDVTDELGTPVAQVTTTGFIKC